MDLRRLHHFVVAAEESSFRRAALRLDTNQSIISRHVRDIEDELCADLFHREPGHGARLTEVGRAFLRDVREMFDNLDHAKMAALAAAYGKRGRLRLAASEDAMTGTLARIITAYREQWPEVHFDLLELPAIAQVPALQRGRIRAPKDLLQRLERTEVERVGRAMAAERGLPFTRSGVGEYVSGKLVGTANLASGRFAMLDDGLSFQLVPWQPVLEKRIGQHISGVMRDSGIEWGFGRKRGLGL